MSKEIFRTGYVEELLNKIDEIVITYGGGNCWVSSYVSAYCFTTEGDLVEIYDEQGFYIELEEYEDEETGEVYTDDFEETLEYSAVYKLIQMLELDLDYYEFFEMLNKMGVKYTFKARG